MFDKIKLKKCVEPTLSRGRKLKTNLNSDLTATKQV